MVLPSSDQAKLLIAVSDLVSCCASPPAGSIRKIWFLSSWRLLRNASHCPSGDQCGAVEDFSPRVSWNVLPDSGPLPGCANQICVIKASCLKSPKPTVYATHFPSGEIWVEPTDLIVKRSSMVGTRRWASTKLLQANISAKE